jgi:hypothetical protein
MSRGIALAMPVSMAIPGYHFLQPLQYILHNRRVSIFIDSHPGCGMGAIYQEQSFFNPGFAQHFLNLPGYVNHLRVPAGSQFHPVKHIITSQPESIAEPQLIPRCSPRQARIDHTD